MKSKLRRRVVIQWAMIAWLAVVWIFLWGDLSLANIIVGLLIGFAVTVIFPLPPVAYTGRVHPVGLLRLIGRFLIDLFRASIQVSRIALRPGPPPRGAVIGVRMRSQSDLYLTLTAEFVSLVPGSLIVETQRRTGTMYVHVLDAEGPDGVEKARRAVLEQEERVLRALGSKQEIAQAFGEGT